MADRPVVELLDELKTRLKEDLENLVKGDLQAVVRSPDPKAVLMRDVEQGLQMIEDPRAKAEARKELEIVAKLAQENEVHFQAMKNGLSALINRFESYTAGADIGAYDQTGTAMAFQRGSGAYVKKV